MIITPSKELLPYISVGEKGEWIHDPAMPEELKESFQKFVEEEKRERTEK